MISTNTIRFEPSDNEDQWFCTNCEAQYKDPIDAVMCDEDDCSA